MKTEKRVVGDPPSLWLAGQKGEWPGHPTGGWCLKWGQTCGAEPLTQGVCTHSRSSVSELNWILKGPVESGKPKKSYVFYTRN